MPRIINPERVDANIFADAVHNFQTVRPLADDFDTWYAEKALKAACDQETWRNAYPIEEDPEEQAWMYEPPKVNKPDLPDFWGLEPPDQYQNPSDITNDSGNNWEGWSQYFDRGKDFTSSKVKSRKWKLSTPPALSYIGEKRTQKLESRTKARKTTLQNYDMFWGDGATICWGDTSANNHPNMLEDSNLNRSLQVSQFKTSYSDRAWSETRLLELDPKFKKYRAYQPTLLRWCCTLTEA